MNKLGLLIDGEENKFFDYAGLFLIGTLSLGYSLYSSYFAKLHVDLPFIKVPFFIGEIIFLICFCLFLVKRLTDPRELSFLSYLVSFYLGFVIAKILLGYFRWGPLALRHSVLFLYPLFAVFSASFYRRDFFKPNNSLFLIFIFFVLFIFCRFFEFYIYSGLTCFLLTLILINTYPKRPIRYSLYSLLLLLFPYGILFNTARTFIISNLIAIICLVAFFLVISKRRGLFSFRIIFSLFIILFIFYGLKHNSSHKELRSLVEVRKLVKAYNESMDKFRLKEPAFVEQKLSVKLYNEKTAWFQEPSNDQIEKQTGYDSNIEEKLPPQLGTEYVDKIITSSVVVNSKNYQLQPTPQILFSPKSQSHQPQSGSQPKPQAQISLKPQTHQPQFDSQPKARLSSSLPLQPEPRDLTQSFNLSKKAKGAKANIALRERGGDTANINTLFRFFIWRDAFRELGVKRPIFGFDFGKPFRSRTIEVLRMADGEWSRDGWICFHNSYVDIVYRAGFVGIFMVGAILIMFFLFIRKAIQNRSLNGILLIGILINWFIAANFLEILEMPYSAIPLWSLFGLTSAYLFKNKPQ